MKLVVFDCDGTLVDSQKSIVDAMVLAFEEHELPAVSADRVRRVIGLPLDVAIAELLGEPAEFRHETIAETYRRMFRAFRAAGSVVEPLYDGAADTVRALDEEGWLLGIATGKARRGLDATLGPLDLLRHFVTMQTADVAMGKPHPEMLERAVSEAGVTTDVAVMVGDTTFDMEMAQNAGVASIGVSWGYHPAEALHAAGAHVVIDEWRQLTPAIIDLIGSLR